MIGFSLGALYASELISLGDAAPRHMDLFYGGAAPFIDATATRFATLHLVDDDPYFASVDATATQDALRSAHVAVQAQHYPGSRHWFAERATPGFDAKAFARARSRVLAGLASDPSPR